MGFTAKLASIARVLISGNSGLSITVDSNGLPVASHARSKIQPITASVATNALTCTLNPTSLDFRSTTLGGGTTTTIGMTTAVSLIVPSTATLGTTNTIQSRLVLLALNNAGTIELAVVNSAGGNDLSETGLISTTAITTGATANNVIYSTTARTNVPFRVVGYVESTQATAGTWATAPSTIQGMGGQALAAMSSLGYGQTWQNVTRVGGTTYYNTTGKPIVLVVSLATSTATCQLIVTVNGINAGVSPTIAAGSYLSLSAVIPPGAAYVIACSAGTLTVTICSELR